MAGSPDGTFETPTPGFGTQAHEEFPAGTLPGAGRTAKIVGNTEESAWRRWWRFLSDRYTQTAADKGAETAIEEGMKRGETPYR